MMTNKLQIIIDFCNYIKVFEYSPYDKTLLLDIDYIVKSDKLLKYFEGDHNVCMYDNALTLRNELPADRERFFGQQ